MSLDSEKTQMWPNQLREPSVPTDLTDIVGALKNNEIMCRPGNTL